MRRLAALSVLASLPSSLLATPYDGVYRQAANAECALIGVDGAAIAIRDGIFYGVDAECRMVGPVNVVDMDATLYTMECTGEGAVWSERAMIMHTAERDGVFLIWNGYAFRYDRCPENEGDAE